MSRPYIDLLYKYPVWVYIQESVFGDNVQWLDFDQLANLFFALGVDETLIK